MRSALHTMHLGKNSADTSSVQLRQNALDLGRIALTAFEGKPLSLMVIVAKERPVSVACSPEGGIRTEGLV